MDKPSSNSMSLFPWLSLVAIIWLQSISGTNTDFPAYSSQLKARLGISQVLLNNLAVASDVGKLMGWSSGFAAKYPPLSIVALIGAFMGFIGYGVQYLYMANRIRRLVYWQYFLLNVLAGNSICWINTVCYMTSMINFPMDHGFVIGLATSYNGLSAKIYVALSQLIAGANSATKSIYLLVNSIVPMVVTLISMPLLKEAKPAAVTGTRSYLIIIFAFATLIGGYSVMETLVPELHNSSSQVPAVILLVMIISVGITPFAKAVQWHLHRRRMAYKVDHASTPVTEMSADMERSSVASVVKGEEQVQEEDRIHVERGIVGGEHGVWDLARSVDFWTYFLAYLCGATLGLVYANNLGQIVGVTVALHLLLRYVLRQASVCSLIGI